MFLPQFLKGERGAFVCPAHVVQYTTLVDQSRDRALERVGVIARLNDGTYVILHSVVGSKASKANGEVERLATEAQAILEAIIDALMERTENSSPLFDVPQFVADRMLDRQSLSTEAKQ